MRRYFKDKMVYNTTFNLTYDTFTSYNMTALQAVNSVGRLVQYVNTYSNYSFGNVMCIAFFFVLLARSKRSNFGNALLVTSFWTFIITLFGVTVHFVSGIFIYVWLILLAIGWFMSFVTKESKI